MFFFYNKYFTLKDLGTFCYTKQNVHRLTLLKHTQFEDNDSSKLPLKYYMLRYCSFCEMSKTSHKNIVCLSETDINLACKNVITSELW